MKETISMGHSMEKDSNSIAMVVATKVNSSKEFDTAVDFSDSKPDTIIKANLKMENLMVLGNKDLEMGEVMRDNGKMGREMDMDAKERLITVIIKDTGVKDKELPIKIRASIVFHSTKKIRFTKQIYPFDKISVIFIT